MKPLSHRPPLALLWTLAAALAFSGTSCMRSATSATSPPSAESPLLECRLAPAGTPRSDGPVEVRFTLSNRSDKPLYILQWYTPIEGLLGDVLIVERDGTAIPYQGPLVKRGNPGKDSYFELAAGASRDATVDLRMAYDLQSPGRYTVRFERGLSDLVTDPAELPRPMDSHRPVPLSCSSITIEVP